VRWRFWSKKPGRADCLCGLPFNNCTTARVSHPSCTGCIGSLKLWAGRLAFRNCASYSPRTLHCRLFPGRNNSDSQITTDHNLHQGTHNGRSSLASRRGHFTMANGRYGWMMYANDVPVRTFRFENTLGFLAGATGTSEFSNTVCAQRRPHSSIAPLQVAR
jgi:hypothetical protein